MRSEIADCRLGPFENLAQNPFFTRAVAGSTVVRRNECGDPRVATALVWFPSAGSVRGTTPSGKTALVLTRAGGVTALCTYYNAARPSISPGETLAVSVEGIVGPGMRLSCDVQFFRADGSTALVSPRQNLASPSFGGSGNTIAPDGVPTRFGRTHVAPSDAVRYGVRVYTDNGADGTAYATDVLVEKRPALLPFFYAGMQDESGIVYELEGTGAAQTTVAKATAREVRRNLFANPRAVSDDRFGGSTTSVRSLITDFPSVGTAVRTTRTATGAIRLLDIQLGTSTPNAGESLLFRCKVRSLKAWTAAVYVRSAGGIQTGQSALATGVSVPAGDYEFVLSGVSINGLSTSSSAGVQIISTDGAVDDWVDFTEILVEVTAGLTSPYFDGSRTPDGDLMPAWTGTANFSQSVLYGVAPQNSQSQSFAALIPVFSWLWKSGGPGSLRTIPLGTSSASGNVSASPGNLIPGRTYTAMVKLRLAAPIATSDGTSRSLDIRRPDSSAIVQAQAPNVAGEYVLRVTWVATAPNDQIRLAHRRGAGTGDIWWSDLLLVEGVYTGPFPDPDRLNWRGQVNGSAQVFYPRLSP